MASLNGMHVENANVGVGEAERNRIVGADGCVTVLHLQAGEVYPRIRQQLGAAVRVHVRMYTPNWYALDPTKWAADCVRELQRVGGLLDDPNTMITPANEPDLEVEGHPSAARWDRPNVPEAVYAEIWRWGLVWTEAFRKAAAGARVKVFTVPLAGGHEPFGWPPDSEYQVQPFAEYVAACDGIAVHAYCNRDWTGHGPDTGGYWAAVRPLRPKGWRERTHGVVLNGREDPGGVVVQYPNKPFAVVEFGNWHHHDSAAEAVANTMVQYDVAYREYEKSGRCVGITPFIWNSGDGHRENRFWGNGRLIEAMAGMRRYKALDGWTVGGGGGAGGLPAPVSGVFVERYPKAYEEWVKAGGVENNFRVHCLAIMANLPVGVEDVEMALRNAESSIAQARAMLKRLVK